MSSGQLHLTQRRYSHVLCDRGVRIVWAAIDENHGNRNGVIPRVARESGVRVESLRRWVNQAEVDRGSRPGTPSEERRISEFARDVRKLRRANEILKAAASFYAEDGVMRLWSLG